MLRLKDLIKKNPDLILMVEYPQAGMGTSLSTVEGIRIEQIMGQPHLIIIAEACHSTESAQVIGGSEELQEMRRNDVSKSWWKVESSKVSLALG